MDKCSSVWEMMVMYDVKIRKKICVWLIEREILIERERKIKNKVYFN